MKPGLPDPIRVLPYRFVAGLVLGGLLAACSRLGPAPAATLSPREVQGRTVFAAYCSRCHATSGNGVVVGPSLAGIATRGGGRVEGLDAAAYIRASILTPDAYVVEGFAPGTMPADLKDVLSPDDLQAVVAFLLTLR